MGDSSSAIVSSGNPFTAYSHDDSTANDWTNSARACDCRTDTRGDGHDSGEDAYVQQSVYQILSRAVQQQKGYIKQRKIAVNCARRQVKVEPQLDVIGLDGYWLHHWCNLCGHGIFAGVFIMGQVSI